MNRKHLAAALGGGMAVATTLGVTTVLTSGPTGSDRASKVQDTARNTARDSASEAAGGASSATLPEGVAPAAVSDRSCSMRATPALGAGVDKRVKDAIASNLASQADPARPAMSRAAAVAAARSLSARGQGAGATGESTSGSTSADPAAVAQLPFSAADSLLGGDGGSLVAAERCTWLVTVQAPFQPRSGPSDEARKTYDSYTAMFDALSGQYLGLSAGTDAANLITGDGVNSAH